MKGIVLLSDGIDSPVAFHIMSKEMECIALHLSMGNDDKIREIMKLLHGRVYFVPYEKMAFEIMKVKPPYRCVVCKRFMYRVAERVAKMENAEIVITGENLGQVASQTIDNMAVIEEAVNIPVVRPLIAFDKQEIVDIAKEIGTYEISIKDTQACSMAPKKPVTKAKMEVVREEERKLNFGVIDEVMEEATMEKF
ncbi:MAG: hypothetical protein J7K61_03160 [Thermoplasmata archaeon]|nr:hypothetical protein [Thermoplasmata archaeon]